MAQFAVPSKDENLTPGWNVQNGIAADGDTGYAQPGNAAPGAVTVGQTGAGGDSMNGSTGPYVTDVLQNGSYTSSVNTVLNQNVTVTPTGLSTQNPFGLPANAYVTIPEGVTEITVNTAVVWSGTVTESTVVDCPNTPGGAVIATTGANATSITFTSVI